MVIRQRARRGRRSISSHAHDWPAAMVLYLLRQQGGDLSRTRTVLTIHNLAHQGVFPPAALGAVGLGADHFTTQRLEFYGQLSFLKGGILAADAITTVSNTYAREIVTPELGELLDGVLSVRKGQDQGIVNGIDYAVWNPMTDPAIAAAIRRGGHEQQGALQERAARGARARDPARSPAHRVDRPRGPPEGQRSPRGGAAEDPEERRGVVVIAGEGDEALAAKLHAAVAKSKEAGRVPRRGERGPSRTASSPRRTSC